MTSTGPTGRWWRHAAIYQVYVRSFQDSNGDGTGDLRGVMNRLDHLARLGISVVWLSPTMPSPNDDWGYDVSDYRSVHPYLGTLSVMDELIAAAGRRGIQVLLDLVPNHTSSAHPWFVDARSGRTARHRDWYVWADPAAGGGPPNNWLDSTGATAWTLHPATGQYYLHNFLPSQPDLNWWNPEVQQAFEGIIRFWLDRGVAGFRIDVAHGLFKDRLLRDDPPSRTRLPGGFGLARVHSMNQPEVHDVYRHWRKVVDSYSPPRLLLGETWVLSAADLQRFYGDDDELQLCFNFFFAFSRFTAADLSRAVTETLAALPDAACPIWMASNHDISRFPTRWAGGNAAQVRLALCVMATLPGAMVFYQGDELGLPDVEVPLEDQRDAMTRGFGDGRFNRDGARTPMPWDESTHGGFTENGVEPWLPMGDRSGLSVQAQDGDPGSVLNLTRQLIGLRPGRIHSGGLSYSTLPSGPEQWVYRSGSVVVAANFSDQPVEMVVPPGRLLLRSGDKNPTSAGTSCNDGRVSADPWEALILEPAPVPDQADSANAIGGQVG